VHTVRRRPGGILDLYRFEFEAYGIEETEIADAPPDDGNFAVDNGAACTQDSNESGKNRERDIATEILCKDSRIHGF
jgi:hypothetical protein